MDSLLADAIHNRYVITFDYDGGNRTVEPHCYGLTKTGKEAVRAFQVRGYSSSGKMGWRLFDVDKIRNLSISNDVFEAPRPDYKRDDRDIKTVYAQI